MGADNLADFVFEISAPELGEASVVIYDSAQSGGRKTGNYFFNFTEIAGIGKSV